MHKKILSWYFFVIVCCVSFPLFAGETAEHCPVDSASFVKGYALVMANGTMLKVSEYAIDLERETVYFKSQLSGLNATFPLERISRVVMYDKRSDTVPDDAAPLFIPERSVSDTADDGGIPVVFKVTKTIVGSSAATGYARGGGSRPADYRQSYTPSRTSGYSSAGSGTTTQGRQPATSTTTSQTASGRPDSSSGSAADSFFEALFGGRR